MSIKEALTYMSELHPPEKRKVDLLMDKISWLTENTLTRAVGYIKSGHRISLWQGKGK